MNSRHSQVAALVANLVLGTLKVYDMQGKPVLEKNDIGQNRTQLSLDDLPKGYYLL